LTHYRKFKATTDSRHKLPVAENALGQQFKVAGPNTVWVSDITYVPTNEGWLYLAGHKDLFTGEIVGYAMGERLTRNLVSQSLLRGSVPKVVEKGTGISYPIEKPINQKGRIYRWRKNTTRGRN